MARLRNEEMSDVSVDLHDIFDVNPSEFPASDYLNGKFLSIIGRFQFLTTFNHTRMLFGFGFRQILLLMCLNPRPIVKL